MGIVFKVGGEKGGKGEAKRGQGERGEPPKKLSLRCQKKKTATSSLDLFFFFFLCRPWTHPPSPSDSKDPPPSPLSTGPISSPLFLGRSPPARVFHRLGEETLATLLPIGEARESARPIPPPNAGLSSSLLLLPPADTAADEMLRKRKRSG